MGSSGRSMAAVCRLNVLRGSGLPPGAMMLGISSHPKDHAGNCVPMLPGFTFVRMRFDANRCEVA